MVMRRLAALDGEWADTHEVTDALPIDAAATRKRLNGLQYDGLAVADKTNRTYRWRLSDRGRQLVAAGRDTGGERDETGGGDEGDSGDAAGERGERNDDGESDAADRGDN